MKRYLLSKFSVVVILLFLFSCFPPFEEKEKEDPTPTLVAALLLLSNSNQCNGLWAIDFNTGLYSCQAVTLVASGTNIEIYEQRGLAAEKNRRVSGKDMPQRH